MESIYIIFFVATFVLGFLINRSLLRRSDKYTLKKANVSGERWGTQTKPIFGGITFFSVFLISIISYIFLYSTDILFVDQSVGIILVLTISFFMGLADDMINTSPYFKFVIQIIGAVLLINFGIYINISPNLYINYILTVFWVVGIMNSINMLDNMDAVTALVTISILIGGILTIVLSGYNNENLFLLFVSIGVLAALFSYLFFNWHPSKMYMGDNGSMFLGALLAILGIVLFWNGNVDSNYGHNTNQFLSVALAYIIPITDTSTVTINRLLRKQSPFIGGKDHTTHHLSYLGFSNRLVAIILFISSLLSVFFAVYIINYVKDSNDIYIYICESFVIIVFMALYINTKISKPKN